MGPRPNKKNKMKCIKINIMQAKTCTGVQASEGAEDEEGEWASAGVPGSPELSANRDSSASSSLGMSKLKSRLG